MDQDHDRVIKLEAEFSAVKRDGHAKLNDLADEVTDLWLELKTKLTSKAFAWVVGGLVFIMAWIIVFMMTSVEKKFNTQWELMMDINHKVDVIAVNQGKVYGKLGLNGDNK